MHVPRGGPEERRTPKGACRHATVFYSVPLDESSSSHSLAERTGGTGALRAFNGTTARTPGRLSHKLPGAREKAELALDGAAKSWQASTGHDGRGTDQRPGRIAWPGRSTIDSQGARRQSMPRNCEAIRPADGGGELRRRHHSSSSKACIHRPVGEGCASNVGRLSGDWLEDACKESRAPRAAASRSPALTGWLDFSRHILLPW